MAIDKITASGLGDGGVTTADLADGAVSGVKIANGAVDTTQLANSSVTTDKITDGNITVGKLASTLDLSSNTLTLPDGNITTAKLVDGAVTAAKIGSLPAGSVLQVKTFFYNTPVEKTGSGVANVYTDTGLSGAITPSSASNKILVIFTIGGIAARLGSFHQEPDIKLLRDSTDLREYFNIIYQGGSDFWIPGVGSTASLSGSYLDSPSATVSTTYKFQIRGNTSYGGDMRVGINLDGDGGSNDTGGGGSSLLLMEIAG